MEQIIGMRCVEMGESKDGNTEKEYENLLLALEKALGEVKALYKLNKN